MPTIDNHAIYDLESGMRIHLKLNGIFSYFLTWAPTLDKIENWENFSIVFLSPDGDAWNPHTLHYAENEEAMLDTKGLIIEDNIWPPHTLFSEAELSKLYGKEVVWSKINDTVDAVVTSDEGSRGCPLTTDEMAKLNNQICVQLASLGGSYESHCFATQVTEMLMCPTLQRLSGVSQRMMTLAKSLRLGYRRCWQWRLPQYKQSLRGDWREWVLSTWQGLVHPTWWCCSRLWRNNPIFLPRSRFISV